MWEFGRKVGSLNSKILDYILGHDCSTRFKTSLLVYASNSLWTLEPKILTDQLHFRKPATILKTNGENLVLTTIVLRDEEGCPTRRVPQQWLSQWLRLALILYLIMTVCWQVSTHPQYQCQEPSSLDPVWSASSCSRMCPRTIPSGLCPPCPGDSSWPTTCPWLWEPHKPVSVSYYTVDVHTIILLFKKNIFLPFEENEMFVTSYNVLCLLSRVKDGRE